MAINYLNSINLNKNELIQAQIENQANDTAAGTGVEGQLYYNTTDDVLKVWSDGSWSEVGGGVITLTAGTYLTDTGTAEDPIINHNDTSRSDSTSTVSPGYGSTFDVVDSVSSNATGHVTAINVKTVTLPASENDNDFLTGLSFNTSDGILTATVSNQDDVTVDLDGRYLEGNETITLSGDVTGSGTTSITTTIADGAVEFDMIDDAVIITEAEGVGNNDNDTTIPTTAAVKQYVDDSVAGGLIYQGAYDAATNSPDLTTSPNSIAKGWTYTVTVEGTFFTEQVRVGDVLIAEIDNPTTLDDWTTVQNNVDLASATNVGIGNVNIEGPGNKDGLSLSYLSGTATVGLDIEGLPVDDLSQISEYLEVPLYNTADDENHKASIKDLVELVNTTSSKAYTIADTATITYPFTLTTPTQNDVMIQLVDSVTNETVYADVNRISTTQATITFASTPVNSVRVLVQKIG